MSVTNFPEKGDLFMADCNRVRTEVITNTSGVGIIHKTKDDSFRNEILECLYSNDKFVAMRKYQSITFSKPFLIRRSDFTFSPVDPQLVLAMELTLPIPNIVTDIMEDDLLKLTKKDADTLVDRVSDTLHQILNKFKK